MAYGRIVERVKGTHYVVSACEKLYAQGYNIKLLLYDTPVDEGAARRIKEFTCKCPFEFVVGIHSTATGSSSNRGRLPL